MEREVLRRCDEELKPLVPLDGASPVAQESARAFNADVGAVREALLEPARDLLTKGTRPGPLVPCLERAVAELAFWRRVLLAVHRSAFGTDGAPSDYLLRYVLS